MVEAVNSYAIDFGTSNTVITRWNSATETAEIVKLSDFCQKIPGLPPVIPSLIYIKDAQSGEVLIGQQVRDRGLDLSNSPRFFRAFKKGIGSDVQGFLPELDGQAITFEKLGKLFLQQIINQLKAVEPEPINSLVVTVPVDSFEVYRIWLTELCHSLDIEQVRIIDEPTAAALGSSITETKPILVVDFGGGTIDLSLIELAANAKTNQGFILKWGAKMLGDSPNQKPQIAKVIAKTGQNLGGTDIDNWLVDYFVEQQNLVPSSLVTRLVERLKIKLSSEISATEAYFDDETLESYELALDRNTLTEILISRKLLTQLDELLAKIAQQARLNNVEITSIDCVILVGGSAQLPQVKSWVLDCFPQAQIQQEKPLTTVAEGALKVAQGLEVKDFLYHGYGIRYWNKREKRHSWHPLIKSGQPYPMNKPISLTLGASVPNQPCIELVIGEMSTESSATEVYFEGDRLITRNSDSQTKVKPLNDGDNARTLAKLDPPGQPGGDRVELRFQVDESCLLKVTVEDLLNEELLVDSQVIAQLK